ncbi:MAG: PAS domain-containing protein, partial [Acidimicrobiia bacterium]|nr:PAS domain-containing protein [Acidimicrobiia bacterium]
MGDADDVEEVEPERGPDPALEALLRYLRDSRGFDFSGYKRGSVGRRITKRMQAVGADTYADYQEFLEAQPVEFAELFNTILINVTAFNRDPEAWKFLAEEVVPRLVETKGDDDPIRTWSAGCSSGEETYSLAVVLCDVVGEEEFRRRVKVYGTDADEEALTIARHGRYPAKAVSDAFTEEQRDRYFEPDNADLVFRKDLRRSVIFGRHDLVQDAPISRVDLLVCRNTLMYFNADTQQRVLTNFQFALNEGGYLFLGKSEALVRRLGLFEPVDIKRHVFGKRTGANRTRPSLPPMAPATPRAPRPYDLADLSFENAAVAQIVVDRTGMLVLANRHARTLFGLGLNQVGRPFKDLELSYRPVELRSRIDQVLHERRPSTVNDVQLSLPSGGTEFLDVYLMPLTSDSQATAVALTFLEVGRYKV